MKYLKLYKNKIKEKYNKKYKVFKISYYNKKILSILEIELTNVINNEIIKELRLLDESNSIITIDSDKISMCLKKENFVDLCEMSETREKYLIDAIDNAITLFEDNLNK